VCGQTGTAAQALTEIAALSPDLVILDISLAGTSGVELIKDLTCRDPILRILVLSTHDETALRRARVAGWCQGLRHETRATQQVMAAIRQVLGGGVYLSERMRNRLLERVAKSSSSALASDFEQLSDRELQVFQLIGEGRSTRQIGASLHLSVSTVETYRAHIKEKLRLENATELVQRAVGWVHTRDL